jgi:hypothetical protein
LGGSKFGFGRRKLGDKGPVKAVTAFPKPALAAPGQYHKKLPKSRDPVARASRAVMVVMEIECP